MSPEEGLIAASVGAAALYGTRLVGRPPSRLGALVKPVAVGGLAGLSCVAGAPWPLTVALGLSALGDAALAGETRRGLPVALAAFLAAQLAYVRLFAAEGGGRAALLAEPWRNLGVAGAMAAGTAMLLWLWRGPGPMRPAAAVHGAALAATVGFAFTLPYQLWPAMAGAAGCLVADALLSAELFAGLTAPWAPYAAWWLYYAAQGLIVWAYLR
jgi:uncharacterized membrane protein YhhN